MRRRERVSVVWQVRRRRLFNICQCVTIGYRTLGHFPAMSALKKQILSTSYPEIWRQKNSISKGQFFLQIDKDNFILIPCKPFHRSTFGLFYISKLQFQLIVFMKNCTHNKLKAIANWSSVEHNNSLSCLFYQCEIHCLISWISEELSLHPPCKFTLGRRSYVSNVPPVFRLQVSTWTQ